MNRYLDEELAKSLDISTEISFFYKEKDGTEILLNQKTDFEQKILLSNIEDSWDYSESGVGVKGEITLGNPSILFGTEKLINIDGELGLAFQWISKQSQQRYVEPIYTLNSSSKDNCVIKWNKYFEKNALFGEVKFSILLYVKKVATYIEYGQPQLTGIVLGKLNDWEIILDGSGSTFPIVLVNEPEMPLWHVEFYFIDPLIEPFDKEYIAIYVNKAHGAFNSIINPKTKAEKTLYIEFLANALHIIYLKLKELPDWDEIEKGNNCEEGSIGEAMHYFITTLELHFDYPEKLAVSIRRYLESQIKLGES